MFTKKDRRHSGWVTPNLTIRCKKQFLINNCLEPQEFYDDWTDYRDGYRSSIDKTKIRRGCISWFENDRLRYNKKNKLLLKRRKAKKHKLY